MTNTLPYRPCVGLCLFNEEGQVFVGQRIDSTINEDSKYPGAWQMPQGGVDENEDIKTAAFRELKEEIGTDKAKILRIHDQKLRYDLPPYLLGKLWGGRYGGQIQTWVALRFTGQDSDIILDADDHPEFSRWRWVPLSETIDLIVPFQREIYKPVIDAFKDLT